MHSVNLEPGMLLLRTEVCHGIKPGCRVTLNLMLFKSIQTLSVIALGSLMSLPFAASAASCSSASYYGVGDGFHGRPTASGERFNTYDRTAAHRWLPFGTLVRVTNSTNGRSVVARITDRGPFVGGRDLDLSYGAFTQIASASQGVVSVCYAKV